MKYIKTAQGYLIRLSRGELLQLSLKQFIKDQNLTSGWVHALGAAEWVELGYFEADRKDYIWKRIDEILEITSIQGNIAWEDSFPIIHLHGAFSDKHMVGYGGHIKELSVAGTCEVFITKFESSVKRSFDASVGLHLLDI